MRACVFRAHGQTKRPRLQKRIKVLCCIFLRCYSVISMLFWRTTPMATRAIRMFCKVEGLFCVYKPPGVHWKHVRDRIETCILEGRTWHISTYLTMDVELHYSCKCNMTLPGVNQAPSLPLPDAVKCLSEPRSGSKGPTEPTLQSTVSLPALAAHPLGAFWCWIPTRVCVCVCVFLTLNRF